MNIICDKCGKDSGIESTDSFGTNMALAQRAGFIPKILTLFTNNAADQFIACSKDCAESLRDEIFAKRAVTDQRTAEVSQMLEESKAKIPQMAEETVEAFTKFQNFLKTLIKK